MKYSFIVLLDEIDNIKKKLRYLNVFKNKEVIIIGPKEYEDDYNCDNYIVDDLTNIATSINKGIEIVSGDYINISYSSSYIKPSSLKKIKNDSMNNIYRFNSASFKTGTYSNMDIREHIPNEYDEINNFSLIIDNYFIPFDLIDRLDDNLKDFACADFIINNICNSDNIVYFENDYVYISRSDITDCNNPFSYNEEWYTKFFKEYLLPLLKNNNSDNIMSICYYLIIIRFLSNRNDNTKVIFSDEEYEEFINITKKCLDYIPLETILNFNHKKIHGNYNNVFVILKNKDYFKKCSTEQLLEYALSKSIEITTINEEKDKLIFDCAYHGVEYIDSGLKIEVKLNNKDIDIKENKVYRTTKFFNDDFDKFYTFSFIIDKKDINNSNKIDFYLCKGKIKEKDFITFPDGRPHARLSNVFNNSYWKFDKNYIMTTNYMSIFINEKNWFGRVGKELALYKDFIFQSKKKSLGIRALLLRILYRLSRFLYKNKRIWVTFDKLYKGGDNGEYFYHYCNSIKDNIKCYYIINRSAYDYKRLKREKYVVPFKSLREYLAVLNAEAVFATHAGCNNFMAFTKGKEKYFRDLFSYDVFCLQHGLTIQDIPQLQNRLRDNTKLYFCASKNEIDNLSQDKYDYDKKSLLLTGIARYDGLINNDKKQILITPTWRHNMANTVTQIGSTRPYYEDFINTPYYKIYNSIINDDKLIKCAKKYGYKIVYLLHPTLTAQIDDFDKNEYVDIYTVTEDQSYEKLLCESSLMVTDYSGVQYDFAYMRKPIIYFHTDELPNHYGAGGIDYEKEGFGPIVKTNKELIDLLCEKIKDNCKNNDKYIKRCTDFFEFDDNNSSERIYNESLKYFDNKNK